MLTALFQEMFLAVDSWIGEKNDRTSQGELPFKIVVHIEILPLLEYPVSVALLS